MNYMGQTPVEQWAPPWAHLKMFDGKDSIGMDYTVVESYLESMCQMKANDTGPRNIVSQEKITSDSTVNPVNPLSPEKSDFEENAVLSPSITKGTNAHNIAHTNKLNNNDNSDIYLQKSIDVAIQCSPDLPLFSTNLADGTIKEEPVISMDEMGHQPPMGWGAHHAPMHFDSLRVVSEHLVERIKLEDSVFRDALQNGSNCQMYTTGTSTPSLNNSWGIASQCNVTGINPCLNAAKLQDTNDIGPQIINKEHFLTKHNKSNISRNMNSNFMCTTMFLMNESLQQNNSHQPGTSNIVKKHDIFNIACEKGCNCEATNSIFRAGNSLVFAADKHVGGKHFMTPCGPLQLTAQECGEFLLKKASVSGNLIGDASHLGPQNISNSVGIQQKIRHLGEVEDGQQASINMKVPPMTGQKYRVDKERPFSCQECGKSFLLKHHLVTHARVHTGERPHVCPECGKSFAHKHCLSTHLLLHSSERPYKCLECKKSFTLKHHLVTHARVHSRDRPFICQECGRTFPQKRHLVTHAKFHSGERPYVCEECGESFSQKDHLVIHSRFHGGQQPYACPDCGSTFARKFELVNHGRLHGRMPHACEVCGKEFLQKRTLIAHTRLHSGEERSFVCQHCGETFTRKPELIEHSKIHTGDKPFICRECGNCFSSREGLALHYRLHAGDRNVVADLCGLASALQQPTAHFLCPQQPVVSKPLGGGPKPKPYACPDCGKCFTQKHGLAQHNKRHSSGGCEVRQHACEKCGKAFFQKNHLALHSRQHMDNPPSIQQQPPLPPVDTKPFEVLIPAPVE